MKKQKKNRIFSGILSIELIQKKMLQWYSKLIDHVDILHSDRRLKKKCTKKTLLKLDGCIKDHKNVDKIILI